MENVKQKVNIDSILKFIENNFKDTDKSEKIRDFGKLVSYFKKEGTIYKTAAFRLQRW